MTKDDYLHALNELKNKRKEFMNEIDSVDYEINIINKDYINRNAKFKINDKVEFKYRIYKIEKVNITPLSFIFIYDIISINGIIETLYSIYENNLKLIERNNNDQI